MSAAPSDVAIASVSEAASPTIGPHRSVSSSTVQPGVTIPLSATNVIGASAILIPKSKAVSSTTTSAKRAAHGPASSHPNFMEISRDPPQLNYHDNHIDRGLPQHSNDQDRHQDGDLVREQSHHRSRHAGPDRKKEQVPKGRRSERDRRVDIHRALNANNDIDTNLLPVKGQNAQSPTNLNSRAARNTKVRPNRSSMSATRDRRTPRRLENPAAPRQVVPTGSAASGAVGATSRSSGGSDASAQSAGSAVRSVRSAGSAGEASEDGVDDADKGDGDEDEDEGDNDDADDADGGGADDGADDDDDPDDEDADDADDEDEMDADPDAEIDADADAEDDDEDMGNGQPTVSKNAAKVEKEGPVEVKVEPHIDVRATNAVSTLVGTSATSPATLPVVAQPASVRRRATKTRLMYNTRELATPLVTSATMDEYREGCLKLEKARHARVYEAERRLMHLQQRIVSAYRSEVEHIFQEHMANRRAAARKALIENAQNMRRLERRRFGVRKHDGNESIIGGNGGSVGVTGLNDIGNGVTGAGAGTSNGSGLNMSRRHDMELRGRDDKMRSEDDGGMGMDLGEKPRKTRKTENKAAKVKVTVELDEQDILSDLAELRGEKRAREPDPPPVSTLHLPERKAKKKK